MTDVNDEDDAEPAEEPNAFEAEPPDEESQRRRPPETKNKKRRWETRATSSNDVKTTARPTQRSTVRSTTSPTPATPSPRPVPVRPMVRLVTCGWNELGVHHHHRFRDLLNAMRPVLRTEHGVDPHIFMDCRQFTSSAPEVWRRVRMCTGKNALLQQSLLSENRTLVKKFFQGMNEDITRIMKKQSKVTIIFICKSGCHRSVAMAELTSYVLTKLDFDVGTIRHLNEAAWEARSLCRGSCSECHPGRGRNRIVQEMCLGFYNGNR